MGVRECAHFCRCLFDFKGITLMRDVNRIKSA